LPALLVLNQHLQQGGQPSPIDRYNGARWAARAVDFLDEQGANPFGLTTNTIGCSLISRSLFGAFFGCISSAQPGALPGTIGAEQAAI